MAIDNPEAIKFHNEKIRTTCDRICKAYYRAKGMSDEWIANNMGAIIPVSAYEIMDGAHTDGRHINTGNDANVAKLGCDSFISLLEANSSALLNSFLKCAANPQE